MPRVEAVRYGHHPAGTQNPTSVADHARRAFSDAVTIDKLHAFASEASELAGEGIAHPNAERPLGTTEGVRQVSTPSVRVRPAA